MKNESVSFDFLAIQMKIKGFQMLYLKVDKVTH